MRLLILIDVDNKVVSSLYTWTVGSVAYILLNVHSDLDERCQVSKGHRHTPLPVPA